jgi:hypothetical protein
MMIRILLTLDEDDLDQGFNWMNVTVEHLDIADVETITHEELDARNLARDIN